MSQNEIAIEIIRKRIQVLERRKKTDKRYGNRRAAQESIAIIRELHRILAEIERESGGRKLGGEKGKKRNNKQ